MSGGRRNDMQKRSGGGVEIKKIWMKSLINFKEEKAYYDDMKHDYDGFVLPKNKKKKKKAGQVAFGRKGLINIFRDDSIWV